MKHQAKTFSVSYTKKVGGEGQIIVKAMDEPEALNNAAYLCFTGSDFRNPKEVDHSKYTKPRNQGFQGSERA